ncbi:MAG: carboxypeptidase regulatory-like domain-containing protein [Acidobacteriota bacterium]
MKVLKILVFLVVIACTSLVYGQTTGSVEGVVTDAQGGVVSGATVTVTEMATGRAINITTNEEGYYAAKSLQPGIYSVKIEKDGFSTATVDRVVLQVGQVARADVGMKVGSQSTTVQVDIGATDLQVDTTRQNVDGVITARQITELPMNSRNYLDLASSQPGVTVVPGGNIDPTKVNAYRGVRINGGSGTGTRIQLEGIDVTDENVGTTIANFSTDAVQEFQLSRSSFDLSTGLTTSGAISLVTRSGGNQFHGSGFYFKQDDKFDARPGFESDKPEFNRDQEGYRVGGRIWRDKLFFFSNFERLNQANFSSFTSGPFPALNAASTLPVKARYALNRLDWVVNDKVKAYYLHNYNDDSSTGGTIRSPFQNIDWTNTHIVGVDITGSRISHAIRFGYINFNNRIASSELDGFPFTVVGGTPIQINVNGPNVATSISLGPNSNAPQQSYQDNYEFKYDGTTLWGNHTLRFGAEATHTILGGFANFAGPAQVTALLADGSLTGNAADPLSYPLNTFQVGPNSGFFTPNAAHGLPFGGRTGTRYAVFSGDTWKVKRNLTLNLGLRWTYDTNAFAGTNLRIPELDRYGAGLGDYPKYPKNAFSPQIGFAWDPKGDGKTSIRGGFNLAYEGNIYNNSLFDSEARLPLGIAPTAFTESQIFGPDNSPIVVTGIPGCDDAETSQGIYTCLLSTGTSPRTLGQALPFIAQINAKLQAAYSNLSSFNPNATPNEFTQLNGDGELVYTGDYKVPYSMQFNIGFQHELKKGHVLSVDYVRLRGVRIPIQLQDLEDRRDARFFDEAAARTSIGNRIGQAPGAVNPTTIATFLAANPTASIATFALANDTIWTGQSDLTSARASHGGFSLYQGIQISLRGRFGDHMFHGLNIHGHNLIGETNYTLAYALAENKATSGSGRSEFLAGAIDNRDLNKAFGPSGFDRRHVLTIDLSNKLIGGFRLDQRYFFFTPTPFNLLIPNNRGTSGLFTSDFNGDGSNTTTPRGDLLPGTNVGSFGRRIRNLAELNEFLGNYNSQFAGQLTPAGQRLVDAGIFTKDQLVALGGAMPFIPLVPEGNPDPFQNVFYADYRLSRPIKIWKEGWSLEPSLSVFNVFNNAPLNSYSGLAIPSVCNAVSAICPAATGRTGTVVTTFGALNYDYAHPQTADVGNDLSRARGLNTVNRRQLQFGLRFTF